ncbi:flagellar hook assembly protein FlgD [Kineosporia babensis]|uniref:FlgD Ig-like domain-containing protein n=1 Tax=Kineosporia babensis TaxID=499548 RepID=A0A9X1SY72_9ACTN|nr:hypothetical protein [Kineosporia babensis]MCD5316015.1 hypothetical protein [Kineosporia babensis]
MQIRTVLAGVGVIAATLGCGVLVAPAASAATSDDTPTATLSASAKGFSPNGDGKQDTITFSYEIPQSGVVALEFLNSKGAVIGQKTISDEATPLLGLPVGSQPAGEGTYTWRGDLDQGLPLGGHQDIKARLVSLGTTSLTDCLGSNLGDLLGGGGSGLNLGGLDLSNPDLQCADKAESGEVPIEVVAKAPVLNLSTSLGTVYPVRDGFRDSVKLSAKATKAADTSFTLTSPKGDVVRKWAGTADGFKVSWNGTDSSGDTLKPGFYKLTGTALGEYGNKATVKSVTVRVSAKEFEMRDGEWKLKG